MNHLPLKLQPNFSNNQSYTQTQQARLKSQVAHNSRDCASPIQIPHQSPQQLGYSKIQPTEAPKTSNRCEQFYNDGLDRQVEFDHRMYMLMKEQIEVSAANYREKINSQIRVQTQQIQRLNCQLINNAHIISRQAQVIKRFTEKEGNLRNTRLDMTTYDCRDNRAASKSPGKLSLTQKKFIEKPRLNQSPIKDPRIELEPKIQLLSRRLDEINVQLQQTTIKTRQIFGKITNLEKDIANNIWRKLGELKVRLSSFCQHNEQKIIELGHLIDGKSTQRKQLVSHMSFLRQETEQIKQLIVNISSREFAYDSYPLSVLKEELKKLAKRVDDMSKSNKNPFATQAQTQQQSKTNKLLNHSLSLQYSQRLNDNASIQQVALNRSQLSSLSHYAPKYVKAVEDDRFKRSNNWEPQEDENDSSFSSDEDGFFYPEVQSELLITEDSRLQRIIAKENSRLPVKVQIDQTGYIKYSKTGMYILDEKGDGFELSSAEIQTLKIKGVITF